MREQKTSILLFLLNCLLIISLSACHLPKYQTISNPDFRVGVIETTEQRNRSKIGLYDDSLNLVGTLDYNMGSMGMSFYPPQIVGSKMYVIPQGTGNEKELSLMLELDLESGEDQTIDIGLRATNSFCVSDQFVFASATWNGISTISRASLADQSLKQIEYRSVDFVEQMQVVQDELFVVGFYYDEKDVLHSTFAIFNIDTMELIREEDISDYGVSHLGMLHVENRLYITSSGKRSQSKTEQVPDNRLIVYDLANRSFHAIELGANDPATMTYECGKLYVLQSNLVTGESHGVTIIDIETEETHFIALDHGVYQIAVKDGCLYALSDSSIYQYRVIENAFSLVSEKNVRTKTGDNPYFYVSSMLVR